MHFVFLLLLLSVPSFLMTAETEKGTSPFDFGLTLSPLKVTSSPLTPTTDTRRGTSPFDFGLTLSPLEENPSQSNLVECNIGSESSLEASPNRAASINNDSGCEVTSPPLTVVKDSILKKELTSLEPFQESGSTKSSLKKALKHRKRKKKKKKSRFLYRTRQRFSCY